MPTGICVPVPGIWRQSLDQRQSRPFSYRNHRSGAGLGIDETIARLVISAFFFLLLAKTNQRSFAGCPLSLRSLCRLTIRRCLGRERLGMLEKLKNFQDFLTYREFSPNNPEERRIFSADPGLEMMLASLTHLMKEQVSPKDLPHHILLRQTVFEGYDVEDNESLASSSCTSLSDLNARVQELSNPLRLLNKKKRSTTPQGCLP